MKAEQLPSMVQAMEGMLVKAQLVVYLRVGVRQMCVSVRCCEAH
jgi:hypothetical protein